MSHIDVNLYMHQNCTLCKEAYYLLKWLERDYPLNINQIDIKTDPELELRYALEIPVIEIDGEIICMVIVEENVLREKLEELSKR